MVDSCILGDQGENSIIEHQPLPSGVHNEIEYKLCPFFLCVLYVEEDRPPHNLFAGGQST